LTERRGIGLLITGCIVPTAAPPTNSDVNKDLTFKAKDKDQTPKDKDKDQTFKAKDQDKD